MVSLAYIEERVVALGNSAGIIIAKSIISEVGIQAGDDLDLPLASTPASVLALSPRLSLFLDRNLSF